MSVRYNLERQPFLTAHDQEAQDVLDKEQQLGGKKTTLVKVNSIESVTETILLETPSISVLEKLPQMLCADMRTAGRDNFLNNQAIQRCVRGAGESEGGTLRIFLAPGIYSRTDKVIQVFFFIAADMARTKT